MCVDCCSLCDVCCLFAVDCCCCCLMSGVVVCGLLFAVCRNVLLVVVRCVLVVGCWLVLLCA